MALIIHPPATAGGTDLGLSSRWASVVAAGDTLSALVARKQNAPVIEVSTTRGSGWVKLAIKIAKAVLRVLTSFVTQGDEGVDLRGAPGGEVGGEEGDGEGAEGDRYIRQEVHWANAQ